MTIYITRSTTGSRTQNAFLSAISSAIQTKTPSSPKHRIRNNKRHRRKKHSRALHLQRTVGPGQSSSQVQAPAIQRQWHINLCHQRQVQHPHPTCCPTSKTGTPCRENARSIDSSDCSLSL